MKENFFVFHGSRSFKKKLKLFLVCVLALFLNFLVVNIFYVRLHIPLFFDTVFTVAVTFWLGLVPGLFVAVSYNLINPFLVSVTGGLPFVPSNMVFVICGIEIVLVTWAISRRKSEFEISLPITILYLVLISVCTSFCTTLIGGTIDFVRFKYYEIPDSVAPIKKFAESFARQKISLYFSCILSQVPVSVIDRTLTTFSGYGVYRLCVKFLGEDFAE